MIRGQNMVKRKRTLPSSPAGRCEAVRLMERGQHLRLGANPLTSWKACGQDWANVSQGVTAGRDRQ